MLASVNTSRVTPIVSAVVSEYSSLDVPWKSDEEAAVKWILEREPDFFEKENGLSLSMTVH